MAETNWRLQIQKLIEFSWNSILGGLLGQWLRIWDKNSEINEGGYRMGNQNANLIWFG